MRSQRISITGVVQGVGFRPFVYQLATRYALKGWVCNTSSGVEMEVEGDDGHLNHFLHALERESPPLARIESIAVSEITPLGYVDFEIRSSRAQEGRYQLISPDIAICHDCRRELLDPRDRRYRYPFTNCTNCGPRFTIIQDIPYDRPKTTMRAFTMCPQCQAEYEDPRDRRFHAQPNACPACGPSLSLTDARGRNLAPPDPLTSAARLLKEGGIVAIKGLGGFHLACDATDEGAVRRMRRRKGRPDKPLAVMMASLEEVKEHCSVSPEEAKLLLSPQRPIVLLPWKEGSSIVKDVAPGNNYLGVMLPYTPLHHLLLREAQRPLVMTSGNRGDEPIAKDNGEARERLQGLADYFLFHNREIYARCDDSVWMVEEGPQPLRRSRGYAPYPIHLPFPVRQVLACGGEEKNTFCFTKDNYAFLSPHIGDLENLETLEFFQESIEHYQRLFRLQPEVVAHDMHPDYLSTRYALELAQNSALPLVAVQHHHAHIASCLLDNGVEERVIGVAFDGTGFGLDGRIWGGEFLVADLARFQRVGHLEYLPLPGGEAAIRRPYRLAAGYLYALLGDIPDLPSLEGIDPRELKAIRMQIDKGINAPLTSSCGRLFDAVSALLGVRGEITYEAQAAIELEMASSKAEGDTTSYPFQIAKEEGHYIVKLKDLLAAIVADLEGGLPTPLIGLRFHETVVTMVVEMCQKISKETGINGVALSGGVFQNRLLLRRTAKALREAGFAVYTHRQVPANDGGLSLGQAIVAHHQEDVSSHTSTN